MKIDDLITQIKAQIKSNTENKITGDILQKQLLDVVKATYDLPLITLPVNEEGSVDIENAEAMINLIKPVLTEVGQKAWIAIEDLGRMGYTVEAIVIPGHDVPPYIGHVFSYVLSYSIDGYMASITYMYKTGLTDENGDTIPDSYEILSMTDVDLNSIPPKIYDVVITSQEKFNELIADSNWNGAQSVCFIGEFVSNTNILIPDTVLHIQGMNGAHITVSNYFGYANNDRDLDKYSISDLKVTVGSTTPLEVQYYAFVNCSNLTNCIGVIEDYELSGNTYCAFKYCTNLTNCTGIGGDCSTTNTILYAFDRCKNLTNCIGITGNGIDGIDNSNFTTYVFVECKSLTNCTGTSGSCFGSHDATTAFKSCTNLTNCTGTSGSCSGSHSSTNAFMGCTQLTNCTGVGGDGVGENSNAFMSCKYLTNCIGTSGDGCEKSTAFKGCRYLTNCTGTSGEVTDSGESYAFFMCFYASNCILGNDSVGEWGGTNTNIDYDTCDLERPEA